MIKYAARNLMLAIVLLVTFHYGRAFADQLFLQPSQDAQATRACSFDAVTAQKVTVTASSSATSNATGLGTVRVVCTKNAWFKQATAPTATTSDSYIAGGVPEYMWSPNVKFAFIRDTEDGACTVTACK